MKTPEEEAEKYANQYAPNSTEVLIADLAYRRGYRRGIERVEDYLEAFNVFYLGIKPFSDKGTEKAFEDFYIEYKQLLADITQNAARTEPFLKEVQNSTASPKVLPVSLEVYKAMEHTIKEKEQDKK